MNEKLKNHFRDEIGKALMLIERKEYVRAFVFLERAHILGQRFVMAHTISHWYMLKVGWLKKDLKEVMGQLIRLPLGIIGPFIGVV